ncbi:hypothetical protein TVAG_178370 [Trichomonas vaginalis G3]|uniref:Uncharacterized protein n=1 Tax=Trichomonas vaginalis (strain ATCC PRA-98 / G3) TaxID=412133 RepID=A2DII9_TRIV3|nr:hypothetical protein TVAGG3_0602340 [Trichomonas vaginalis G3]EAY19793.1 hypothetical protein TVAG_178370 [Trichomonas vaginalis G3]KAI5523997.1 hypothetical protein TVAGG3_0602340 [Trichomonas vaginalis G3]|eukprot:XP_001580779.1 hypothetical protein [Trichomonas vaginalis G3]
MSGQQKNHVYSHKRFAQNSTKINTNNLSKDQQYHLRFLDGFDPDKSHSYPMIKGFPLDRIKFMISQFEYLNNIHKLQTLPSTREPRKSKMAAAYYFDKNQDLFDQIFSDPSLEIHDYP